MFYLRNLPLKFGQNQISNRRNGVFVVDVVIVVIVFVVTGVVDQTNLPFKFG